MPILLNNTEILNPRKGLSTIGSLYLGTSLISNAIVFSPLDLAPTAWFSANNPSTIFSAEYPEVNASIDSSIALILGLENGTELSPELLANGSFDTNLSSWVIGSDGAGWSVVDGRGYFDDTERVGNQGIIQTFSTTSGLAHRTSIDYQVLNGQLQLHIPNGASLYQRFLTGTGTRTGYLFLTSNTPTYQINPENTNNLTRFYVDNASIRSYPSRYARQTTAGNRPIYRQDENNNVRYIENVSGDSLNWTAPAGTYTIAYLELNGNVTVLTDQSLNGATNIMLATQIVEYVAINRTLTEIELSNLVTYLEEIINPPATFLINNGVWDNTGQWVNSAIWSNE